MIDIKYFVAISSFIFFQFIQLSGSYTGNTQDWKLTKSQNGIKVYTRHSAGSNIKEIRVTTSVNTSTQELMEYLSNVPDYTLWVYKCNVAKRLQTVSSNEFYYYTNTDFPFPLFDRDLVVHSTQHTDPHTGVIHSKSVAAPHQFPLKKNKVRITKFESNWLITPQPDGSISIDYTASTDPGGYLPAWVINMGISAGPLMTMKQLKEILE